MRRNPMWSFAGLAVVTSLVGSQRAYADAAGVMCAAEATCAPIVAKDAARCAELDTGVRALRRDMGNRRIRFATSDSMHRHATKWTLTAGDRAQVGFK